MQNRATVAADKQLTLNRIDSLVARGGGLAGRRASRTHQLKLSARVGLFSLDDVHGVQRNTGLEACKHSTVIMSNPPRSGAQVLINAARNGPGVR